MGRRYITETECGWWVRLQVQPGSTTPYGGFQKSFAFSKFGGKAKALVAAVAYRDEQLALRGIQVKKKRNTRTRERYGANPNPIGVNISVRQRGENLTVLLIGTIGRDKMAVSLTGKRLLAEVRSAYAWLAEKDGRPSCSRIKTYYVRKSAVKFLRSKDVDLTGCTVVPDWSSR